MALTKNRIVGNIYQTGQVSRREAVELVESVISLMKASLGRGDDLLISGFGRFSVHPKQARLGRNPYTGTRLMLRARRVVTFKPSRVLKRRLNERT
jgi:integration host factor subunit alpha